MQPVVFRCSRLLFGLLLTGGVALAALAAMVPALGFPIVARNCLIGAAVGLVIYALTLLPTKLVLSQEGLCQKQLLTELNLQWGDIAEWRYIRSYDGEVFWIRDKRGTKHEFKHWLVFGKRRSKQVAELLRQNGVLGVEEYHG